MVYSSAEAVDMTQPNTVSAVTARLRVRIQYSSLFKKIDPSGSVAEPWAHSLITITATQALSGFSRDNDRLLLRKAFFGAFPGPLGHAHFSCPAIVLDPVSQLVQSGRQCHLT